MSGIRLLTLFALLAAATCSLCQARTPVARFGNPNTFSLFGEYSNDSSHILLGGAENRKLINFGGAYSRRIVSGRLVSFSYYAEVRPIIFESDPVVKQTVVYTSPPPPMTFSSSGVPVQACRPASVNGSFTFEGTVYTYTATDICSRRWTWGEGFSPAGIKLNFLPRRRLQPVFTGLGGYMFSTKPIPVPDAGSANFTFEFGAGFEFFRSARRSIRAEYRYHHISNNYTAMANPGIDSGLLQISYSFGR